MKNTNTNDGNPLTESVGTENTKEEIKKALNHILVEDCGYWGGKLDVLYEQLDTYKRSGDVAKLIAQYLLLEEVELKDPVTCWECGKKVERADTHYYYHADQDDLVCTECGKKLKHSDTAYTGMPVVEEDN